MNKLVFKGHNTKEGAEKIKKILIMLGGNTSGYSCLGSEYYYYINDYDNIEGTSKLPSKYESNTIFTLEEFETKFPYTIYDAVTIKGNDDISTIISMFWNDTVGTMLYILKNKKIVQSKDLNHVYVNYSKIFNNMNNNVEQFKQIAKEISELYEKKNRAYGNSFGNTYKKLGIISAVTRISDKYNRLCNLATNPNINDLNESIEDTLKDLAAYSIMTLMEIQNKKYE